MPTDDLTDQIVEQRWQLLMKANPWFAAKWRERETEIKQEMRMEVLPTLVAIGFLGYKVVKEDQGG